MLRFTFGFILCSFLAISSNGCSSSSAQAPVDPFPTSGLDFAGELLNIGELGDGRLLLGFSEPGVGQELYVSDGTPEGTELVVELNPGPESGALNFHADFNGGVYFSGDTPSTGVELWFSDGTPEGTILIEDATPGSGDSFIRDVLVDSDALYVLLNLGGGGSRLLTISGSPN